GNSVFYQPDPLNPLGYLLPWHLDTKTTSAASIPQNDHDFEPMHLELNNGAMDGFIQSQLTGYGDPPYTMGYYARADLPFDYALADTFTICDNYFHSVLSVTNANRTMAISGTIDPEGNLGGPSITDTNDYQWITYPEQLSAAGVSWRNYLDVSSPLNPLHVFSTFQNAASGSELFELGMAPHKGLFEHDVANDTLPTVSWITVPGNTSEHPSQPPAGGAQYLYGKLNAIAANPTVWAKTVVIVHYDEGDGKFDHVRPPIPPPGTPGEFITGTASDGTPGRGLAVGPGFRVPCIVISPWTVGGRVCSDPFDHTSVLQFLGKVTGVAPANVSDWRLATFGDMTSVFHPGPPTPTMPPLFDLTQWVADTNFQLANFPPPVPPTTNQTVPHQEPGGRPHIGFGYPMPD
ncbi:MAG: phospholipase, partial [Mycobacterium sp.]|nr:phospholipase [Mycobacterium sp.]